MQLSLRKELESYQGLGSFFLLICFILLSLKFFLCFLVYLVGRKWFPYSLPVFTFFIQRTAYFKIPKEESDGSSLCQFPSPNQSVMLRRVEGHTPETWALHRRNKYPTYIS